MKPDVSSSHALVSDDGAEVSRRAFGDAAVYAREQETIFRRCWLFLGHESQLARVGDYFRAFMGEVPVIVTRGKDRAIHVLLDACRHRGVAVCRADRGNTRSFVCPYHHWSYGLDGALIGVPRRREIYGEAFRLEDFGLVQVPRVESYRGLIFGCLDPEAPTLTDYLGRMAFYLDCVLDRTPGGTEVMGPPQRWTVDGNWKLPAENQVGDNYHGPHLHGTMAPKAAFDEFERFGVNIVPESGHGLGARFMPSCDEMGLLYPGSGGFAQFSPSVADFYRAHFGETRRRLGPVGARVRPLSMTIFPNLSILFPTFTVRVAHPRGPERFEMWSWCLVPADAPPGVKRSILQSYNFTFGPSGTLEQEDGVAWQDQLVGNRMRVADAYPYYYGMCMGQEGPHTELPGLVGPIWGEHNARHYYRRWRDEMAREA